MVIEIVFEKGKSFWEKLITKLQGFSHVAILMDGYKYETHPRHGVIVNPAGDYSKSLTVPYEISKETQLHIIKAAKMFEKQGFSRWSVIAKGVQMLTGIWIGGRPEKFDCASWVAFCLWPEKNWWKYDIKKVYENII